MLIMKKILDFSGIALAAALILLFADSNSQAALGRLGNYSQYSAHGGGTTDGLGNNAWGAFKPSTSAYKPGNCAHCHEQHASIGGSEPVPVKPGPSGYLLFDDLAGNVFCNYCHGPAPLNSADSISPQISKTYAHKPTGSAIRDVLCHECHDSHEATTTTHIEGTNAASGTLSSVAGVVVSWGGATPPALPGTENIVSANTTVAKDPITLEYELCLSCHGGQIAGLPDISGQFDPGNFSVHPIAAGGTYKNPTLNLSFASLMIGPWAAANDKKMYCGDCHGSDNWGVDGIDGPHGSNNQYMLKDMGPVPGVLDTLCDNCHTFSGLYTYQPGALGGGLSAFDDQPAWNPDTPPKTGDHTYAAHVSPTNPLGCIACHGGLGNALRTSNIHGANYRWPNVGGTGVNSTAFLVGGPFNLDIYTSGGFSYCSSACHAGSAAYRYK